MDPKMMKNQLYVKPSASQNTCFVSSKGHIQLVFKEVIAVYFDG
jgi:hypothetical protein